MTRSSTYVLLVALLVLAFPPTVVSEAQSADSVASTVESLPPVDVHATMPERLPVAGPDPVPVSNSLCDGCESTSLIPPQEKDTDTTARTPAPGSRSSSATTAAKSPPEGTSSSELPGVYRIQSGDTLYSLSQRFGVSVERLREWNDLKDSTLEKGDLLRVRPLESESSDSRGSSVSRSSSPSPSPSVEGSPTESSSPERSSSQRSSARASSTQASSTQDSSAPESTPDSSPQPYEGAIPLRYPETSPLYDKVHRAATMYRRSGDAPVIQASDDREVYPYGKEVPTVKIPVLHFSTIKLAKNEYVTSMSIGDKQRWSVTTGSMGQQSSFQQMVYVKPQECGPMRTNLLLATNQGRTYELILESIPCNMQRGESPDMEMWDRRISYYYPDGRSIGPANMSTDFKPPQLRGRTPPTNRAPRTPARQSTPMTASDSSSLSRAPVQRSASPPPSSRMNRRAPSRQVSTHPSARRPNPGQAGPTSRYKSDRGSQSADLDLRDIDTEKYEMNVERGFPCEPSLIGDDGERTYIRLGDSPGCANTFPYYTIQDRELQLVNYNVFNGDTYVIEGVHEKAALVFRDPRGREKRVTIENTAMASDRRRRP